MFYSLAELVRKIFFTTLKICSFIFFVISWPLCIHKRRQCSFGKDPKVANVLFALPKIATCLDALLLQRPPTLSPYVFLVVRKGEIKKNRKPVLFVFRFVFSSIFTAIDISPRSAKVMFRASPGSSPQTFTSVHCKGPWGYDCDQGQTAVFACNGGR